MLFFMANYQPDNSIQLNWATASEVNCDYFGVEYSLDGENFLPYTKVKGAGNNTETQNYYCPFTLDIGNVTPYFRLKQVDNNGKFYYSQIITLGATTSNVALAVINAYYNNSNIITHFTLDVSSQISFTVYDISGQEVYTSSNQFARGANEFLIPAPDVSGVYILVFQNGSFAPVHKKVMITK
jgi:hypothetical protein